MRNEKPINYYMISSIVFLILWLIALQMYVNASKTTDYLDQEVVKIKRETCYNQKVVLDQVRAEYATTLDEVKTHYQSVAILEFEKNRKGGGEWLDELYRILGDSEMKARSLEKKSGDIRREIANCL